MRKIFINENIDVYEYDAAEPFLKEKNDLPFFDETDQGIHKVSQERWQTAQTYEKLTWMVRNPGTKDDRNFDHLEKFGSLQSIQDDLSGKSSIIELGCGPFTNLRLISPMLTNPKMVLLDPLINDYINLEHCSYKDGTMNGLPVVLVSSPIETFNPTARSYEMPSKFDVVVMINVIEHCYDVDAIFDKILNIINPDGVLIFSDVYFNDVKDIASNLYDAGHPLRLSEIKMNKFLQHFQPLYDNRYHGLYGQEWRNDIYFIGRINP